MIALANPVAADVLSAVESRHWIVPWPELLNEEIETGEQLCAAQKLKALCS